MSNCIFHIPYSINSKAMAAPMIRPRMMINALEQIGYQVDVVEGNSKDRIRSMKKIKENIINGKIYDFAYAESSTMATMFTDQDHIPRHPFADYAFFGFLKKKGIKIGLFYRDIYWRYEDYKCGTSQLKYLVGIMGYRYDLWQYKRYLDKLYVPSMQLYEMIKCSRFDPIVEALPPGCIETNNTEIFPVNISDNRPLHIFYVGGIGNHYEIVELVKAIYNTPKCELTICCRKQEWERNKDIYDPYLNDRIKIIHKTNDELEEYYQWADIGALMFKPVPYMNIAMPYKSFEYLSHLKPSLATKNTAIGKFVSENGIGWSIDYNQKAIQNTLNSIIENPDLLNNYNYVCEQVREKNTWVARATQVAKELSK